LKLKNVILFLCHLTLLAKDIPSAPFGASVPTQTLTKAQLSRAPPPSVLVVPSQVPKWGQPQQLVVRVQRPMNSKTVRRIHSVIEGVAEYGPPFEALLMERERFNEDYAFLFDSTVGIPLGSLLTVVTGRTVL